MECAESTLTGILSIKKAFDIRIRYCQEEEFNDPLFARLGNPEPRLYAQLWHIENVETTLARLKPKHTELRYINIKGFQIHKKPI